MTTTSSLDSTWNRPAPLPSFERSSDLVESQSAFGAVLGKHLPDTRQLTPAQRAREAAEQFVTVSLVQPLLKQLRESNHAAPPFAPTDGEKQFRALTDATLAQNIVKAKQFPVVDRVAADLLKRGEKLASGRTIQDELDGAQTPLPQNRPSGVTTRAR